MEFFFGGGGREGGRGMLALSKIIPKPMIIKITEIWKNREPRSTLYD